jgi:tetratricopeptide (TPR) repeat protein
MVADEQGRFEEAEANYRKALELKLEFGDRRSAGSTYHQLGNVAQEQGRFEEAEANYRQAFALFSESDRRRASQTATRLGLVLGESGRHDEAAAILMDAAVIWYQLTGNWDPGDLRYLEREREFIGDEAFITMVAAKVPPEIQTAFTEAYTNATNT